jgi:hypothetical protein
MQRELAECEIAERTVREYVHDRKIALGFIVRETCVPQSYTWGVEAQNDGYEAYADLAGERIKLQVFAMRSMASGAAFHCAYLHATQQAFLEAHELAFAYFGGVFRKLRYDNLTSAVKKILRGSRREETARFVVFRSHWRFEAEFCTPAEPHEKGGIEGEAGYFRRNHWVPVPKAADIADRNRQLLENCQHDEHRLIAGREQTVGAGIGDRTRAPFTFGQRRRGLGANQLRDSERSGLCEGVDQQLLGAVAGGCAGASQDLCQQHRAMAWGPMRGPACCYRRQQQILDLEHYLDVLYRKPGALAGSKPLEQASGRSMAAELRPDLGSADGPSGKTERDAADD